jgi:hypothetical protein
MQTGRTWREEELRPKPTRQDLEERLRNVNAEVTSLEALGYDTQSRELRAATQQRDKLKAVIAGLTELDAEATRRDTEDGLDPERLAARVPR